MNLPLHHPPVNSCDFANWDHRVRFCLPSGIGDISWIYSKFKVISSLLGLPVDFYVAGDPPLRGADLVQLLPEVNFAGYLNDRDSWFVHSQCLPAWTTQIGYSMVQKPFIQNVSANLFLESGRPLRDWFPELPTDYHYPINISPEFDQQATARISSFNRQPVYAVYVSNRDKDKTLRGGWRLWDTEQWVNFLVDIAQTPGPGEPLFVFLGAEYDRDKTEAVADELHRRGYPVEKVIGQPLGLALAFLRKCNFMFSYPSGMGILANVLRVPAVMLLPWFLKPLENTYADPHDIMNNKYRAWTNPKPQEVLEWFRGIAMWQSMHWF